VLVVEDDAAIRQLLADALLADGCRVSVAVDGYDALDLLDEDPTWHPDVIVLDLSLPRVDGASFAQFYARMRGPHAPVLLVTGAPDAAERMVELHAGGYLQKPFDVEELCRLVHNLARNPRQ
jgi:DNA-binding response OmpR family regulator